MDVSRAEADSAISACPITAPKKALILIAFYMFLSLADSVAFAAPTMIPQASFRASKIKNINDDCQWGVTLV